MSDTETFELKPIRAENLAQALDKARKYRLLGDPLQTESICLDILAINPEHQEARI